MRDMLESKAAEIYKKIKRFLWVELGNPASGHYQRTRCERPVPIPSAGLFRAMVWGERKKARFYKSRNPTFAEFLGAYDIRPIMEAETIQENQA